MSLQGGGAFTCRGNTTCSLCVKFTSDEVKREVTVKEAGFSLRHSEHKSAKKIVDADGRPVVK